MKIREALRIIENERLTSYSLFTDRNDSSDEVVIKSYFGKYIVYATNEKASKISGGEKIFNNEEDALDNFIKRLRALNKYNDSM